METLIPGLIDDLGRECLIRIPFNELPTAYSISKFWRSEITNPGFTRQRKSSGLAQTLIVLGQAQFEAPNEISDPTIKEQPSRPTYRLVVSDPKTGSWVNLPAIPGQPEGLPMFCGLVSSGSDIVLIGGWDPVTLKASNRVYIYSFLSGKWRNGKDMPGVRRSFFGCAASNVNRTVVIAGGHDEDKNALKSVLLYDVDNDKWVPLPDMCKPRDECKVICQRGMFHVISGYPTDMQGRFERSMEVFDLSTWQWGPVVEDFLEDRSTPASCVAGPNGGIFAIVGAQGSDVAVWEGDKWQVIAEVPADVRSSNWITTFGDKLVVIGSTKQGEAHSLYMLDLRNYKWAKIEMPKEFSGHVQCGCVLEI